MPRSWKTFEIFQNENAQNDTVYAHIALDSLLHQTAKCNETEIINREIFKPYEWSKGFYTLRRFLSYQKLYHWR